MEVIDQIKRIKQIVEVEYANGRTVTDHVSSAAEELGEFVQATRIESGYKKKDLDEPAKNEAIDLIICGLALYYGSGGEVDDIAAIMNHKLNKWENNMKVRYGNGMF